MRSQAVTVLTDAAGDVVAEVTCYWILQVDDFSDKSE